jgi:saccharopine dehydrogenase-like NADP-dependent oxidoreductase
MGLLERIAAKKSGMCIDVLTDILMEKLKYLPHERDMVMMVHDMQVDWGRKIERMRHGLVMYGDKETAMAKTVGIPCAIGVDLILQRKIRDTGVIMPMPYYEQINACLYANGIKFNKL